MRRTSSTRAHPRSRGENHFEYAAPETIKGSSPLTRGKHHEADLECLGVGLIPAHAGKTVRGATRPCRARAHPRSRGENYFCRPMSHESKGSSPLTRGKHLLERLRVARARLIPAHAGKTEPRSRSAGTPTAHPRSRGENDASASPARASGGSSPLTRGKLLRRRRVGRRGRLIPAHAGKTHQQSDDQRPEPAHPRSRGENAHRAIR